MSVAVGLESRSFANNATTCRELMFRACQAELSSQQLCLEGIGNTSSLVMPS